MTTNPCITVLMSVYNTEKYVGDCIRSILGQTFPDFEFIIIDDASTDGSLEIIKSFKDKRIRLLNNRVRSYPTRNKGLRVARGKYICIMDADDISLPQRFERQILFMDNHPEIGLAGSGFRVLGKDEDLFRESDFEKIKVQTMRNNCVVHPSMIIRHDMLKQHNLRYIRKYNYSSDYDLIARMTRFFPVTNIPEVLMLHRVHDGMVSRQFRAKQVELANGIFMKQMRYLGINPNAEETMLHVSLLRGYPIEYCMKRKLHEWLERIKKANREAGFYNENELESFLNAFLSVQPFIRNTVRSAPVLRFKIEDKKEDTKDVALAGTKRIVNLEILTLLSGNPVHFKNWNEALSKLEFDQPVTLRILDNSGCRTFANQLIENKMIWEKRFEYVSIISYLEPYTPTNPDDYMERGRHSHVAQLYSKLFSETQGDTVLTFEEDIVPQSDALKRLFSKFDRNSVGAIGSAYSSPNDKRVVCAAFGNRRWGTPVQWIKINGQLVSLDYIGGGFTLWNLSTLSNREIKIDWSRSLGWDAILCERLRESGLKILLAGDVICEHNNRYIK
jgi:glycosyltransferase involved in cell wall biosynthesis